MWHHSKLHRFGMFVFLGLPKIQCAWVKPGFHIVTECRWQSSMVFGVSGSLEITASRWQSLSVVDNLSWSLVVFQRLHLNCYFWCQTYSLPVVDGLSGSLAVTKTILFCFHMAKMKRQGRWRSFIVIDGRSDRPRVYLSDPVVDCLWGSLLVFAKTSFVFPYSRWQFLWNFKFSNDRKRPLMTIWKPDFTFWGGVRANLEATISGLLITPDSRQRTFALR